MKHHVERLRGGRSPTSSEPEDEPGEFIPLLDRLLSPRIFNLDFISFQNAEALTASMNSRWPWHYIIEKWQDEPPIKIGVFLGVLERVLARLQVKLTRRHSMISMSYWMKYHGLIRKLDEDDILSLYLVLMDLRDSTLRTTWIRREIDKITSMFYFAIVIFTFISALFLLPSFEDKILSSIQGGNQTQDNSVTTTNDDTNTTATITMATNTASPPITTGASEGTSLARSLILVFSIAGLVAVSYMLVRRLSELRGHTRIAFLYLQTQYAYHTARQQINMEDENFEKGLQQVEQYLNNSDWNMARISLNYLRADYQGMFDKKAKLDAERKKVEDRKVTTYQDLGIY